MDIFENENNLVIDNRSIFKLNIEKLLNIVKVPDIQRTIDDEHVENIYNYQKQLFLKNSHYSFNPINLCHIEGDNSTWIIDGQHRFCAMRKLYNEGHIFSVFVLIINVKNEEERDEQYHIVNLNRPTAIAKNSNHDLDISRFIKRFAFTYKDYIKKSSSPQRPNVNVDILREKLINLDILSKKKFNDFEKEFMTEVRLLSLFYSECSATKLKDWGIPNPSQQKLKCKEKKNELYLGLYNQFEWVDRIAEKIIDNKEYHLQNHYVINKRLSIPKEIREKCWMAYNKTSIGKCYVCSQELSSFNMEAGHVNSVYYGGDNSLNNLRPICRSCNISMGTENLYKFKERNYS